MVRRFSGKTPPTKILRPWASAADRRAAGRPRPVGWSRSAALPDYFRRRL